MFVFDVATATFLIGFLSIMIACAFRGVQENTPIDSAGGQWALSALCGGMAALITSSANSLPLFVGTVLDNSLTVLSLAFVHRGTARFTGKQPCNWCYIACVAVAAAGFFTLTYPAPNLEHRIILIVACRIFFYSATLLLLLRPGLPAGTRYLRAILLIAIVWNTYRLGTLVLATDHIGNFLAAGSKFAMMATAGGMLHVLINAFQFRLASERIRDDLAHHTARLQAERDALRATVNERTAELNNLATTDGLTGVANRRHFIETASAEVQRARRYHAPLALLMLDIDHFKVVNDKFGHPAGDRVLQLVARTCEQSARGIDLVARLGGEEFALLLPETSNVAAQLAAERLRRAIAALDAGALGVPHTISASIGVAILDAEDHALEELLTRSDKALYRAKQLGRNRVVTA